MNSKTKKLKTGNENSIIIIILAVLLIAVVGIVGIFVAKDNKGIATFDGGKVLKKEYRVYYQMFSSYLQMYGYSQDEIPMQILQKAASDKMILTDAKAAGVKLSDEDKAEVDKIFADEQYIEYFKNAGFNIDDLREVYYNDYIIQAYLKKLSNEASVEDMQKYIQTKYAEGEEVDMNEYDTSHILFSFTDENGNALDDNAKAELKKEAQSVLDRALAGEDFAELAKEFSDDTTASEGGKYTMYMDGNTVEEYSKAVQGLKDGEVAATLVESSYGYHIIKLNSKVENGRVNNATEREEYANSLFTDLDQTRNLKVDEELLKSFVLEIDPDAYSSDDKTSDDTTDGTEVDVDGTYTTVEQ